MARYILLDDLETRIKAEADYSKYISNYERQRALMRILEIIKELPVTIMADEEFKPDPVIYRYTEERE